MSFSEILLFDFQPGRVQMPQNIENHKAISLAPDEMDWYGSVVEEDDDDNGVAETGGQGARANQTIGPDSDLAAQGSLSPRRTEPFPVFKTSEPAHQATAQDSGPLLTNIRQGMFARACPGLLAARSRGGWG